MKRHPLQPAGFTIIELIVAIGVLSLMMFLATRIFYDAQSGVQRGLQTSQIIATARSTSQPLTDDVRNMNVFLSKYESNSPGFLVIHQSSFTDVLYPQPDFITDDTSFWTDDRDGDGTPGEYAAGNNFDDRMRSDQIGFFRDATGLESLTPGADNRYDSDAKARHAFIWYGHTYPADQTPSLPAFDQPGRDPGVYDISSQLVLGRQALLLVEADSSTIHPDGTPGDVIPSGNNRAASPPAGVGVNDVTYLGGFDVLDLNQFIRGGTTYSVYDDQGVDHAGTGPWGLFRTPTPSTVPAAANQSYFGPATGIDGVPTVAYANRTREWMHFDPGERLRARTFVENDFSTGIFQVDEIAQLHAAFAPHIADFAIEFAADWVDDWDAVNNTPGQDGQPDNEPDRDDAGNIVWYTTIRPNPDGDGGGIDLPNGDGNYNGIGEIRRREPVTYDATLVTISAFDGTAGSTLVGNPFIYFPPTVANPTFVFSHTGDNLDTDETTPPLGVPKIEGCGKYWPYLIRFRYRLMDGKGEFRTLEIDPVSGDEYSVVGRWFEQVVPVPRPQGLY